MIGLADLVAEIPPGRVLDAGCGEGAFTRRLDGMLGPGHQLFGIDPDKDSIDEARRLTDSRRVTYRVRSLDDLADATSRYPAVTISNVLHHLRSPVKSLRIVRTLLADDGVMLLREVCSDGLSASQQNTRDIHHVKAQIDQLNGRVHRETYTRQEIRQIVGDAGFIINTESSDQPEAVADQNSALARAAEFLDDYLEFAAGTSREAELMVLIRALKVRIVAAGLQSPPAILLLARAHQGR